MRRIWPLLILLALLSALLEGPAAESGPEPRRAPGTIRLEGDPDGLASYRIVAAFPNLRFRRPLYLGAPPDGTNRIFVLEQDGRVLWFQNDPNVREVHEALDLRDKVYRRHNEEGLLGLAFHPHFKTNRTLFLHYSANNPRRGVVARFQMDRARKRILPQSERVILEQRQPWGNHNGGGLEFGPDGYLYITFGDGGAANDPLGSGQDVSTWLGAMLRIDVDRGKPYAIPPGNPLVGRPGAKPEIWAYGLRNVWRFSFDRVTGACWAGDVGQNAWEEIDILVKGGNYGWNAREGHSAFRGGSKQPGFIDPVISHDRREARSITGGYVYRGKRLPGLVGAYLYADYATGNLWALRWDGAKVTQLQRIPRAGSVSSFGEDEAGEVYFTAFDGRIYTFAEAGPQRAESAFPRRLSQTGLFTDVAKLTPHASLIPYEVNAPLWSDGADKQRWIMLPDLAKVSVGSDGVFTYPRGTIFVKHFHAGSTRRLETRLYVLRDDGWRGFTYVWNEAQDDADLIDGRVEQELPGKLARQLGTDTWTYPGRADCASCHTAQAGYVLGFRSEQLDRMRPGGPGRRSANQLDVFQALGLFRGTARTRPPWPAWEGPDAAVGSAEQVRAYLDANCAYCHRPAGTGNAKIDLRYETPLDRAFLIDEPPGQGDLGVRAARIVVPGDPQRSLLYLRMQRTDATGMPSLAHNSVDKRAVERVARWIRALKR